MPRPRPPTVRAAPAARVLLVLLALAGLAAVRAGPVEAASTLEEQLVKLDHEAAVRLLGLAGSAQRQKLPLLLRRIHERILELDPEQASARRALGFKKGPQGWVREKAQPEPEPPAEAAGRAKQEQLEAELLAFETERARQIVAAVERAPGERDAARPRLQKLLERLPRLDALHQALGHERVEGRYARPALLDLARRQAGAQKAWEALREPPLPADAEPETLTLPGAPPLPFVRVGARRITGSFPPEVLARRARETECSQRLLAAVLGDEARRYDPSPVALLSPPHFQALIEARHAEESERKRRLGSSSYLGDPFALRTLENGSSDIYGHNVAFFTVQNLASPPVPEDRGRRRTDLYAWLKEGLGCFVTLTLWNSASTSFFSTEESNAKLKDDLAPPSQRDALSLLGWVQRLTLRRRACGLHEVVGRSLNSLDLLASMQAWTFVRFLLLLDPAAFQRLPGALRAQEHGAEPGRVDDALQAAYGKGLDELEGLWRAWLLELA